MPTAIAAIGTRQTDAVDFLENHLLRANLTYRGLKITRFCRPGLCSTREPGRLDTHGTHTEAIT